MAEKKGNFKDFKQNRKKSNDSGSGDTGSAWFILTIVLIMVVFFIFGGSVLRIVFSPDISAVNGTIGSGSFAGGVFSVVGTLLSAIWSGVWWLLFFILSVAFARSAWMAWRQQIFIEDAPQVVLEIRIPRLIETGPRGMDQFFHSLNRLINTAGHTAEVYYHGETTRNYSFEMVSIGGEIHFYARVFRKHVGLISAALLSYYRDIEIEEVEDYVDTAFPQGNYTDIYNQGYQLWGTEMTLAKPPYYPIKSYLAFETPEETAQVDPLSVFMEVLAKIKKTEIVGIQYIVSPIDGKWVAPYEEEIEEMKDPKRKLDPESAFGFPLMTPKTRGEQEQLEAIERNIDKPAFRTVIRFLYFSPQETFYDSFARRGMVGSFNQYGTRDLNAFVNNVFMQTRVEVWFKPYVFSNTRLRLRRQRILDLYKRRVFHIETFMGRLLSSHVFNWLFNSYWIILNTESMATLFHPPTELTLTAPHTQRVESKRGGAQAGLPIYQEESALDRFMDN
ncbi:MAG: hypothetical protein Q8Q32_02245 [bacterium]|nr:hypothetical protein [bacterium]